ncbi:amino acid adenylation domain-containing protein [Micromonospora sp. NPDC020750]|uniref:amino acid adenylation domain-containing protein n=1 Tax=unclassified Micromonospora TaxID=2617518 RepID=UPI0037B16D25
MQSLMTRGQLRIAAARRPDHARHWRDVLTAGADRIGFPADRTPAPGAPARPQAVTVPLGAALADRLAAASRGAEPARYVLVAAAVAALLRRWTGASALLVGRPADGDALAGLLPLPVTCGPDVSYRDLLGQLRAALPEAQRYADYPVELLAEDLAPHAEADRHPFLDVAVHTTDAAPDPRIGVTVAVTAAELTVHHDAARHDRATAERIAGHLLLLLTAALAAPDAPVDDVALVTPADRAVLDAMNDTAVDPGDALRPDAWVARRAAGTPDAVAVRTDEVTWTWAELDRRVAALAATVRAAGAGPEAVVGVLAERSPAQLAAILAVHRAGAAYLPVDPGYPPARIGYLLADSGAALVLAADPAAVPEGVPVVPLSPADALPDDALPEEAVSAPPSGGPSDAEVSAPRAEADGRDLAYVIYTSGSTGAPKGAMIEHRSLANRLAWMQRLHPIGPDDVILHKTPTTFDVSVWELFWWAREGASVCLLPPGAERDPQAIVAAVAAHGVTTLHFVPSMLGAFLDWLATADTAPLAGLRRVFASGEALGPHHVDRLAALLPHVTLVNLYGPTEATVDVTHHRCVPGVDRVPIGRPVDNTRLHVLDERLRVQPVGVPGELCIAGVQLARGYLNRPELTRDRFVAAPDAGEERVYRTGDLARVLPDGTIDYLGRLDHQVKVRGHRVELGEVEEALRGHPAVKDAVVVARDGNLLGYVLTHSPVAERALTEHLSGLLPRYLVPARVVELAEFPLSGSGKLDRRALPDPPADDRPYVPPRTDAERILAEVWADVLGVDRVGVEDNLFALGGNSIHFVTVLARAHAAGLDLTFQQMFRHPTIAGLAASPATGERPPTYAPFDLVSPADRALLPDGVVDAYPLGQLQAGLIFQNELARGAAQYHDIISFLISAPFDEAAFTGAVRRLVADNPIFRTSYHLTGYGEYLQLVHADAPTPLWVTDLRGLDPAEQERRYADWHDREQAYRFVWREPGLVRVHVHLFADDLYRYSLSQHNSALDGWSITLLHTRLFDTYHRLRDGRPLPEPPAGNHFRDYIGLERRAVASTADRDFWRDVLADGGVTELPRWEPPTAEAQRPVVFHEVDVSAGLSERLLRLADRLAVPLKTLLLAAHVKVIGALAAEAAVVTGYEQSGRPESEGATTAMGLFLNTVPLRVDLGDGSWADLVGRVYRAEADLLPHRRYPMAQMKADAATTDPLFETVFNYTHFYLLKQLRERPGFDLLDVRVSTETEFALRAEFMRDFFTDEVRLSLHYHSAEFSPEQAAGIGEAYRRALAALADTPDAPHGGYAAGLPPARVTPARRTFGRTAPAPATGPAGRTPPATDVARRIAEVWAATLDVPAADIAEEDNFFDLGGNSLAAMRVVAALRPLVTLRQLMTHSDLGPLARAAEAAQPAQSAEATAGSGTGAAVGSGAGSGAAVGSGAARAGDDPLLQPLSPSGVAADRVLVCFPYAAGNPLAFRPLAEALAGHGVAVRAVALPGHDPGHPEPLADLDEVARRVADEIRADTPGEVLIWGHCVGAALAVEVTRLLAAAGAPPTRLFLGGKLLRDPADIDASIAEVRALDEAGVVDWLVGQTGFTDLDGLDAEHTSALVAAFRHDALGSHAYLRDRLDALADRPLTVPVTVVLADDDPLTAGSADEHAAWRRIAADVTLEEIDGGGHYFCRTRAGEVAALVGAAGPAAPRARRPGEDHV